MYLTTGDLIAVCIALICSLGLMILFLFKYRFLSVMHQFALAEVIKLRQELAETKERLKWINQ